MSSRPSAEACSRLEAVLEAAGQPPDGCLRFVSPDLWRWTRGGADLALKLFDGPNAAERLRTEAALYRELGRAGAPVPACFVEAAEARALARAWVRGLTLYERLLDADPPSHTEAVAVRRAWLQLIQALAPWNARIAPRRREAARHKRRLELDAVVQATATAFPSAPVEAIQALSHTVASGELAVLPLDASPSNIVCNGDEITFIDLELLGFDFVDLTYAKYVTAVDTTGAAHTLLPDAADAETLARLDSAVTLLVLARAAGLWGQARMESEVLAERFPGRSEAARWIRAGLRLESNATSESG